VSGLAFDKNNLWTIDFTNKKLKKMYSSSIETSTKKMIFEDGITIFPNPASDYIIINNYETEQNCLIEILDLTGKILISDRQKSKVYKLDLGNIKSGQYIVRLSYDNRSVNSMIIKN